FEGHKNTVRSVAFSPNGRKILTGADDEVAILWDALTGQQLRTVQGHWKEVLAAAFAPDGQQVLTGSWDKTALLCEVATGLQLAAFGHPKGVLAVGFRPDGQQVLTGSTDGMTRIWDVATGDELCRLISIEGGKDWVVVTPEGLFDGSKGGREKVCFRMDEGLDV